MKNIKLPYRYDYVGSFLRPDDLKKIRADYEAGKTTYEALKEAEDTAIRDLVAKQKAAGYKLLTDGEFRRKTWYLDFMWGFEGVSHSAPKGGIPFHDVLAVVDDTYLTGKLKLTGTHPFVEHFRFVQALGFDGYRSFKYCLLRDRSGKSPKSPYFDHLGDFDLKPWDRLEDLPLKETRIAGRLLEDALKFLSADALSRAVRMLATARTIDIYGVENSVTPASDLLTKLTYLGLNCRMHTDTYLQQISAAHLGVADVAVAVSHSGCSIDTVKALKQARKAGAGTIAITSPKEPLLGKYADVCLSTGGRALSIYGSAIFSRIPDLAVVDLLYMGIIQSDYERFSRSLDKSGAVIADRGYGDE